MVETVDPVSSRVGKTLSNTNHLVVRLSRQDYYSVASAGTGRGGITSIPDSLV